MRPLLVEMDDTTQDSVKYEKKNQQRQQNLATHWCCLFFVVCFGLVFPRKKSCDNLIFPK